MEVVKLITDMIISLINFIDSLLYNSGIFTKISDLITSLGTYQTYLNDFQTYLSGAYFIFGKPLIIFVLGLSGTVFLIKLVMAIVMIVGQFVP